MSQTEHTVQWFAITPGRGRWSELRERLPLLADAGVQQVLVREKHLAQAARWRLAEQVAERCRDLHLRCWISEDWECASKVGAGVHLSERSPSPTELRAWDPGVPLGLSLHADSSRTPADLEACEHVFLSPVFPVAKAPQRPPLGAAGFLDRATRLTVRAFALGGIQETGAGELLRAGARNLAGIRLFFDTPDPQETLARLAGHAS